jgi:hypothetical protein
MASDSAAAKEIAKATGTAFGDDTIGVIMSKYDKDGNGIFDLEEVRNIVRDIQAEQKKSKQLGRAVMALFLLVIILIGALVGTAIAGAMIGGEAIKEAKVPNCDGPDAPATCAEGNLVRTGTVESFYPSVFQLATAKTEQLAQFKDLTFYVDMTADTSIGGAVEATFKVAGAYKRDDNTVYVVTTNGYKVALHADSATGTITMDGTTFPVLDEPPAGGRRLETAADPPILKTVTARQLAVKHSERRQLGSFSGALMTSASFTMMAASGGDDRRKLQFGGAFGGALLTSGSFTMMAASGGF